MDLKRITDEAKNGVVETYYENGKLASRLNFKGGKYNGLIEGWCENGQLESRGIYKDGVVVE